MFCLLLLTVCFFAAATAPIDVTATLTTDTRISLEWKQPKSLNGNLDQYLIKYKKSTDSTFLPVVNAGKNSSANFENLDIFTEYHFQVKSFSIYVLH